MLRGDDCIGKIAQNYPSVPWILQVNLTDGFRWADVQNRGLVAVRSGPHVIIERQLFHWGR